MWVRHYLRLASLATTAVDKKVPATFLGILHSASFNPYVGTLLPSSVFPGHDRVGGCTAVSVSCCKATCRGVGCLSWRYRSCLLFYSLFEFSSVFPLVQFCHSDLKGIRLCWKNTGNYFLTTLHVQYRCSLLFFFFLGRSDHLQYFYFLSMHHFPEHNSTYHKRLECLVS